MAIVKGLHLTHPQKSFKDWFPNSKKYCPDGCFHGGRSSCKADGQAQDFQGVICGLRIYVPIDFGKPVKDQLRLFKDKEC